jgi:hypothetical protein
MAQKSAKARHSSVESNKKPLAQQDLRSQSRAMPASFGDFRAGFTFWGTLFTSSNTISI